jgi:hypothetical protein
MTHILKSDEVELQGQFQLNVTQTESNPATSPKGWTGSDPPSAGQVRIVENNPEFTIVEITCCCGTKTYLRCHHNNTESPTKNLKSPSQ